MGTGGDDVWHSQPGSGDVLMKMNDAPTIDGEVTLTYEGDDAFAVETDFTISTPAWDDEDGTLVHYKVIQTLAGDLFKMRNC